MRRRLAWYTSFLAVAAVAGCGAETVSESRSGDPTATGSVATSAVAVARTSPASSNYRVTYGWAVPSAEVTVAHAVRPPVAPAPQPALPALREIRTGNHAGYARITFRFSGAMPGYRFQYVPAVLGEASGEPIPLPGNAFLRIQFVQAQAHDDSGASTIRYAADPRGRVGNLRGYGSAGDFEGYVSYGLGIQVAPGSDQVLPIRAGELTRPGEFVIAIDIKQG
jgi:hypothetical protein